nr:MAG TPA: hypothetical protein [Caudoviricetes sp.]DAH78085.1 MAG TPA: hypothetical protein [Bacteriophage sp.]
MFITSIKYIKIFFIFIIDINTLRYRNTKTSS